MAYGNATAVGKLAGDVQVGHEQGFHLVQTRVPTGKGCMACIMSNASKTLDHGPFSMFPLQLSSSWFNHWTCAGL